MSSSSGLDAAAAGPAAVVGGVGSSDVDGVADDANARGASASTASTAPASSPAGVMVDCWGWAGSPTSGSSQLWV